jgi:predicted DCC family thiol-disulfide oxidoreductase YuxK
VQIIFFDNKCGICDFFVALLVKIDKKKILSFAPILGSTYLKYQSLIQPEIDSVILLNKGEVFYKSDAILKTFKMFGFPYSLIQILYIIPLNLRDFIYDLVAKNRKRDFCKNEIKADKRFLP